MPRYVDVELVKPRMEKLIGATLDLIDVCSLDSDEEQELKNIAVDLCDAIPTADVKPVVHGRWIKDESGVIVCSECGEEHEWEDYRATYCDECGAKMDVESEGVQYG